MKKPRLVAGVFVLRSLILSVLYEVIHNTWISQSGSVAQVVQFVGGDLAQDAAHDLSGAGFR